MGVLSFTKVFDPRPLQAQNSYGNYSVEWDQKLHYGNLGVNNLTLKSLSIHMRQHDLITHATAPFIELTCQVYNMILESDLFDHKIRYTDKDNEQRSAIVIPGVLDSGFIPTALHWEPHLHLGQVVNPRNHSRFRLNFEIKTQNWVNGIPNVDPFTLPSYNVGPSSITLLFEYDEEAVH